MMSIDVPPATIPPTLPGGGTAGAHEHPSVGAGPTIAEELAEFATELQSANRYNIGFPGAVDFDYAPLAGLLTGQLLNNIGDPWIDGSAHNHTKRWERWVLGFLADLFRAPTNDWWGYITSGGTESNFYALSLARSIYPDGVVYVSTQAHTSIAKATHQLVMPTVVVRADDRGEMIYGDLADQVNRQRDRAAIVVATVGTTMTEAIDDVTMIKKALVDAVATRHFVHSDGALSGIPLALLPRRERPGFDFADGADSIAVSGHKFVGCPFPCGAVLTRRTARERLAAAVAYTGSPDTTIGGSRSGHAVLVLWWALRTMGIEGLRERAERSRELAAYTERRLNELAWSAWRSQRHAFTVVIATPPEAVLRKWTLATEHGHSHIIAMPGIERAQIDEFAEDLRAAISADEPATTTPPRQRVPDHSDPAATLSKGNVP